MALPIEDEKQFSIGGFQGIKKVRGLITSIDVVDPPEQWENQEKQVVRVDMEETVVLEMFGNEELMDLKDGKFNFFIPYVAEGKTPHKNSIYNKCWIESARELGFKPSKKIGQYATLDKQARVLFTTRVPEDTLDTLEGNLDIVLDADGQMNIKDGKVLVNVVAATKEGTPNHFCFVADETSDSSNVKEYIKQLVLGLNEKAALKELVMNNKAKQFPEFKLMHSDGTLASVLGLKVVDGVYQEEG